MTPDDRSRRLFSEESLAAVLTELAGSGSPDYRTHILRRVSRTRQRPARSLVERWLPMSLVISRPTATPLRMAWTLLLVGLVTAALVASAAIVGSQLLRHSPDGPSRLAALVPMLELDSGWPEASPSGLSVPMGLDVGPDGNLYVANTGSNEIVVLDPAGVELRRWGGTGDGDGEFIFQRDPSSLLDALGGVAVASDGTVYVSDTANDRVQRFGANGDFLGEWGGHGAEDGQFLEPTDVAVGPDGSVYVVDDLRDDIQRFTPDGTWLQTIGRHGSGDGEMGFTGGITVDGSGNLLNADYGNGRVQAWDATGTFLWSIGGQSEGTLFREPTDVDVDPDGHLLVADQAGVKLVTQERKPASSYDIALSPGPNIAAGRDGIVYASAPAEDRILRLRIVMEEATPLATSRMPVVETAPPASAAASGEPSMSPSGGPATVRAGRVFPLPFSADLPSTVPSRDAHPGWWLQEETPGYASFQYVRDSEVTPAYVTIYLVAGVLSDPCHPEDGAVPMSDEPSVDELVDALTKQPGMRAGPVSDITFGEHVGKTFDVANSIDATRCSGDPWLPQWTYRSEGLDSDAIANSTGLPNSHQRIAIIDVAGIPVLIESWEVGANRQEVLEANALVESIRFE